MRSLKRGRTEMTTPSSSSSVTASSLTKRKASTTKSSINPLQPWQGSVSASKYITMDILRPHFEKPLAEVAELFGICRTLLKKICRKQGIARWPHRHILALRKSIKSMESAMEHFTGEEGKSFAEQLDRQREYLANLLKDPRTANIAASSSPLKKPASAPSNPSFPVQSNKENREITIQLQPISLEPAQTLQQLRNSGPAPPKEYSHWHQSQPHQLSYQPVYQRASTPKSHELGGRYHNTHRHDSTVPHRHSSPTYSISTQYEMEQTILRLPPITSLLYDRPLLSRHTTACNQTRDEKYYKGISTYSK